MKLTLNYDELTNCMRCGFCQPACPTFQETGMEAASPRGRIALMKAVVDDWMEPDESFQKQLDLCLGCRACEPACPADVKYGQLLEQARDVIEDHRTHSGGVSLARKAAFQWVFPYQSRLQKLGRLLRIYQKSGLRSLTHKLGLMQLFPKSMREMEKILPPASPHGVLERMGSLIPAKGEKIATVGMFRGCVMDVLFTETNEKTVKLLSEAGFEVVIPEAQNCCGALHAHSGEREQAKALARSNIAAFREANVDYIVSNAGGCGALLIEYDHLLHDDPAYAGDAVWFASRVMDVSRLLLEKGRLPLFADPSGEPVTVSYQDSCHLRNVMKSGSAPRSLIQSVENVDFVELKDADKCCGSAGIYNLTQRQMAGDILEHKMVHVKNTQAAILLHSNPGCLLQMKNGIEKHGMSGQMQAQHVVDFLYARIKRDAE